MEDWEYGRLAVWFVANRATIQVHLPDTPITEDDRPGKPFAWDYIQGLLNDLGSQGWELVAVETADLTRSNYWLKRRTSA